uniref:Wu:fc75a09 n=1 Tax=Astyanax mexicanus TaxID=7994 RepID=A0A3B1J919_ASTMX
MSKLGTLNEMDHLKRSGFGGYYPRHGLKLLYWFAKDFITFDRSNNITSTYHPERGDFGFCYFQNRLDQNVKLLPDVVHKYYEVGNLSSSGRHDFPDYVTEDYTGDEDDSNMDRIIISITNVKWFEMVYVTEHIDLKNFNRKATYRISKGLLKHIRNLQKLLLCNGREEHLIQTGLHTLTFFSHALSLSLSYSLSRSSSCCCLVVSSERAGLPAFSSHLLLQALLSLSIYPK